MEKENYDPGNVGGDGVKQFANIQNQAQKKYLLVFGLWQIFPNHPDVQVSRFILLNLKGLVKKKNFIFFPPSLHFFYFSNFCFYYWHLFYFVIYSYEHVILWNCGSSSLDKVSRTYLVRVSCFGKMNRTISSLTKRNVPGNKTLLFFFLFNRKEVAEREGKKCMIEKGNEGEKFENGKHRKT